MRRLIACVALACLGMLAAAGCDGGSSVSLDEPEPGGATVETVPGCPLTAAQVSKIVGLAMMDAQNCTFADPNGVARVTITASTRSAGATTYEYQRKLADSAYDAVKDLDVGEMAFLAVGSAEAEVYVVTAGASYVVIMGSFELSPNAYEQTLLRFLDAVTK